MILTLENNLSSPCDERVSFTVLNVQTDYQPLIFSLQTLKELKLKVDDAIVFLDREQGGAANLASMGVNVISVVTMTQVSIDFW